MSLRLPQEGAHLPPTLSRYLLWSVDSESGSIASHSSYLLHKIVLAPMPLRLTQEGAHPPHTLPLYMSVVCVTIPPALPLANSDYSLNVSICSYWQDIEPKNWYAAGKPLTYSPALIIITYVEHASIFIRGLP